MSSISSSSNLPLKRNIRSVPRGGAGTPLRDIKPLPQSQPLNQWTTDELYQQGIKDESGRVGEYSSEDDACPLCKTDRHTNPRLRLLISPCYHKLCESCIDKLFTLSAEPCPHEGCSRVIRKTNFIHRTFEDLGVEREVGVRKRIAGIYNKTRKDFDSDRAYDDYLEEIEDITFNLIQGIDVPSTEARISAYMTLNATLSTQRAREAAEDAENLRAIEEYEAVVRQEKLEEAIKEEEDELKDHDEENKEIMRALEEAVKKSGKNVDPEKVVEKVRERRRKEKEIKEMQDEGKVAQRRRMPARKGAVEEEEKYTAHPPTSPSYEGPYVPFPYSSPWDLSEGGGLKEERYVDVDSMAKAIKADGEGKYRAGGFFLRDVWKREIALAMDSLWIDAP